MRNTYNLGSNFSHQQSNPFIETVEPGIDSGMHITMTPVAIATLASYVSCHFAHMRAFICNDCWWGKIRVYENMPRVRQEDIIAG